MRRASLLIPGLIVVSGMLTGGIGLGLADRPEIVFADFEGDTYGDWKTTGTAFGKGPARGTLPGQMGVSGFKGKGLVNSFAGGDTSTGTLTSPEFFINRRSIHFLIGGGMHEGKACINLKIDGKIVRSSTGPNSVAGGSEELEQDGWDVGEFEGKKGIIEIIDNVTGGWGHINVDHIVLNDARPITANRINPTREIRISGKYLHFPVKTGAPARQVTLLANGKEERVFDIELAPEEPDWWAPLDVSAWKDKMITIRVNRLPGSSKGLDNILSSETLKGADNLYQEPLRPQLHFSPRRGWTNDPNGMIYVNGVYHLFFQHNPYGWNWGNMHWGHATSKDMIHWEEQGEALYPDVMGPMFSGSAVIDHRNSSGLGTADSPPMLLFYTAAGNPTTQCLACSTDGGKSFRKYDRNPIIKEITPGNRDPKVLWHEPSQRWVLALYVETREKKHIVQFFNSTNLKDWEPTSQIEDFFECPDLFELPLDGDLGKKKWVLTAASSDYMVGSFDGKVFKPETGKLKGMKGRGFYAAQTFNNIPAADGRCIQIGWLQAPSPGMAFNQAMSLPLELRLVSTREGPRLAWTPVREFESLRKETTRVNPMTLKEGDANPLEEFRGELQEIILEGEPSANSEITVKCRGVTVTYDVFRQDIVVNDHRIFVPRRNAKVEMRIVVDRTTIEVFVSGGLGYIPFPVIPRGEDHSVKVSIKGDKVNLTRLEASPLKSIWPK